MEKKENQILKTLLSDLHKFVTSNTNISDRHFELPSTVKPGTPVAKHYSQALDISKQLKEMKRHIRDLEDENANLKGNLQIQKDLNLFIDEKWKSDRYLLQDTRDRQEITAKQTARLKEEYDCEISKSHVQTKQICDLQRERDELLNRLGKLAGDMLKHENTNLADLSDVDRPMKLSEAYSELYDNEWTDAFEELTGRGLTDNDAVAKLLDMLLVSFHKCREITWDRYRTLKAIVSTIDILHFPSSVGAFSETEVQGYDETLPLNDGKASEVRNGRKENHLTSQMTLSTPQEREIKAFWLTTTKAIKQEAVKHLYTVLLTHFDTPIKDLVRTSKYLTSCIDLCWKMVVQEKPMYLDTVAEKNGGSGIIFDLDRFRAYTKSGGCVDFVVWPALFLREGGPILVKGIAQGCNKSNS